MAQSYTATINPGLEAVLQKEIRALGGKKVTVFNGGVSFRCTRAKLYHILKMSRCANAIRWNVETFKAKDIREFYRKIARMEWREILREKTVVSVNAVSHKSCVSDVRDIEKAAKDALISQKFLIAKKGQDSVVILVRIDNDRVQVSIDIGGAAFYKRGWRQDAGAAPLRETIASSLLQVVKEESDWNGETLYDPMCGSGTFVIEAALTAMGRSPRVGRSYSVEKTAAFDKALWQVPQEDISMGELRLLGADNDGKSIRYALANAGRAKLEHVKFVKRELVESCQKISVEDYPVIIANPPYGGRIGKMNFIEPLREKVKEGVRVFLLVPRDYTSIGRPLKRFRNGGIPVEFIELNE